MSENYEVDAVRPLPKDWEVKPLVEVSTGGARNGYFKKPELVGKGYKLINVSELYQPFGIDTDLPTVERVEATQSDYGRFQVVDGDTFFTRSSLVLGGIAQCNVIRRVKEPTLFECHVIKIAPDKSQVCPEFVAYSCRDTFSRSYLMSRAKQTTMTTISQPEIEQLPVPIPPLLEQRKIAKILTTVDNLIEKTEALIAKYQAIKQGMMHDLFTRGVNEHGHLRPLYDEAPKLYKESELGWIPKEWEVSALKKMCDAIVDCPHSTPDYGDSGIPCIRTADMIPGKLLLDQVFRVTEKTYQERTERLVPKAGDIIYSREGERLGIASLVEKEVVCLGQRVMHFRPQEGVDSTYLVWVMNAPFFYSQALFSVSSTTSPHINIVDIKEFLLCRPTSEEQRKIGRILASHTARVNSEKSQLEKLRTLKTGLMQDLLTGKVRVKIDESEEVLEAHV